MAVMESWYQSKSSDILCFIPWPGPVTGNNHSETEGLRVHEQVALDAEILVPFSWGVTSLLTALHSCKTAAVSPVLSHPGEHSPSLLSSGSLPCTSLPTPLFGGCDQRGIRINQDSDCKKNQKNQTNGDKISFSLEAKGWAVWMNVLGCKNYDAFR